MKLVSSLKLSTIIMLLVAISAVGFWEFRKPVLETFGVTGKKINLDNDRTPNPSPASKTQLTQFADTKDWIVGVNIVKVDFKGNRRDTTFRYFKEQAIEQAFLTREKTVHGAPLFIEDEASNQRLVNLINGQFSCIRTLDTLAGSLLPVINQFSISTCMAPIPPGYGDFVGYINVFLKRQPTGAEIGELQQITGEIALDMYQRDIVKSTRTFSVVQQPK